jgi:hypothetical protein
VSLISFIRYTQRCDSVTPKDCDFLEPGVDPPCLSRYDGDHALATIETQARRYLVFPVQLTNFV